MTEGPSHKDISFTAPLDSYPYLLEQNISIPSSDGKSVVRVNIFRPKDSLQGKQYPVLATSSSYGKDIPYSIFNAHSFSEVNPSHKTIPEHSVWETPDPLFWTSKGFAVVRVDERGSGQSPGFLDPFNNSTVADYAAVIEWIAEQPWSNGKVGLMGISYYGATQWQVAARKPKGLACIVPWEGFSDSYRDWARHGGILSHTFSNFCYNGVILGKQYGKAGRPGPSTIEGDLTEEELKANRSSFLEDLITNKYSDDKVFKSREFKIEDVTTPVLSVANWGGIGLHLRGNVEGYNHAQSALKYLRFIVGRHDLPFYYDDEVAIQLSFLNAFLKGEDDQGWTTGAAPKVDLILRKGNPGINKGEAENAFFPRRTENEWPIARTQYTKYYLHPDKTMSTTASVGEGVVSYDAPEGVVQFTSSAFDHEVEVTGHIVVHLNVSCSSSDEGKSNPKEIDLFVTLRHLDKEGKEVFYTGTAGDPVPVVKGWLRVSLHKVDTTHPRHREYLPYRDYSSSSVVPVNVGEKYEVDVELWPTNVVVSEGGKLMVEVSAADTQGDGLFKHNSSQDRIVEDTKGHNHIHWSQSSSANYITLPIIPSK